MIGAREAALLALYDIFYEGKYSNLAVKDTLSKCRGMEKNEKALFTNLVYGVVSRHYTLEYVIKKFSSVKPKKLAKYVRLILELAIYQIMYMDKIPQSAAVNEGVKLSKRYCKRGSDRFINGVLRAVCNGIDNLSYPDNEIENMSVTYSYSPEMTQLFIDNFGKNEAREIMEAMNLPSNLLLRPNILKTTPSELADKLSEENITVSVNDDGMITASGFDVGENKLYKDGYFSVQDRGAYNASVVLNPQSGETVIDMCAAPGGKTTHIAELMGDTGDIYSWDIYDHKIKLINNACKRLGIKSVHTEVNDATKLNNDFINKADKVLCDVPCSGWGIIRRKPDIKLSHTELDELYEIQFKILKNASMYVKKEGVLVYSTCTLNKRENGDNIDLFLKDNKEFEKVYEKTYYPHKENSDGFYICKLIRK